MPTAMALARISGSSASRSSGVSCLESLMPQMRVPAQRRHAHFVHAADVQDARVPERLLEGGEPRQPPPLRLRLVVALLDSLGDSACPGARVLLEHLEPAAGQLTVLLEEEALQIGDRCAAEIFGAHRGAA